MATLESVLNKSYEFANGLFFELGATYTSLIVSLTNHEMAPAARSKYLHPLRDLPEYEDWTREQIEAGQMVTLIGKDVDPWITGIINPIAFWCHGRRQKLVVWLAVMGVEEVVHEVEPAIRRAPTDENRSKGFRWPTAFLLPCHGTMAGSGRLGCGITSWIESPYLTEGSVEIVHYATDELRNLAAEADIPKTYRGVQTEAERSSVGLLEWLRTDGVDDTEMAPGTSYVNLHIDPFKVERAITYASDDDIVYANGDGIRINVECVPVLVVRTVR